MCSPFTSTEPSAPGTGLSPETPGKQSPEQAPQMGLPATPPPPALGSHLPDSPHGCPTRRQRSRARGHPAPHTTLCLSFLSCHIRGISWRPPFPGCLGHTWATPEAGEPGLRLHPASSPASGSTASPRPPHSSRRPLGPPAPCLDHALPSTTRPPRYPTQTVSSASTSDCEARCHGPATTGRYCPLICKEGEGQWLPSGDDVRNTDSVLRSAQTRDPTPECGLPFPPRSRVLYPKTPRELRTPPETQTGVHRAALEGHPHTLLPHQGMEIPGGVPSSPLTSQPALPTRVGIERHSGQLSGHLHEGTCHRQPQTQPGTKRPRPPPTHLVSTPVPFVETWTYNDGPTLLWLTHRLRLPMAPSQALTFQPDPLVPSLLPSA